MSVTPETRSIPTVAKAIDDFIARRQNQRGTKELVSILQGARTNHVVGKRAASPALARSEFGDLRFDRVSGADFVAWLHRRHPSSRRGRRKRLRAARQSVPPPLSRLSRRLF